MEAGARRHYRFPDDTQRTNDGRVQITHATTQWKSNSYLKTEVTKNENMDNGRKKKKVNSAHTMSRNTEDGKNSWTRLKTDPVEDALPAEKRSSSSDKRERDY